MMSKWDESEFAKAYAVNSQDADMNWYEHEVNRLSVRALIPGGVKTILDFGCGPGEFTHQLVDAGYNVDGCDASSAMISSAREEYPRAEFFVWNGATHYPFVKTYDACVSVLALHFVNDPSGFAKAVYPVLKDKGALIISVPHPLTTIRKAKGEYFDQTSYDTEIGSYGITVTMIHRSIQDYINPFWAMDFHCRKSSSQ